MRLSLSELAERLECAPRGNGDCTVVRLAPLMSAGPDDLAFVVDSSWRDRLQASSAGIVIVPEALAESVSGACLISPDPYASFAKASWLFAPEAPLNPGVHPTALVDSSARVAKGAMVGAQVIVEADAVIDEGARIDAQCIIGQRCHIGAGTRLFARVVLGADVTMGTGCRVQSGAVIGSEGFGYARTPDGWSPIRQIGGVRIGDAVHVGANTTIDSGAIGPTVIERGVILDNQIQIAHNVQIGENTAVAGCTGIAGSTRIGRDCMIGGACNIVGHLTITDKVVLNAASLVVRSIEEPGRYGSGGPLQPEKRWRRTFAALGKLDELARRVRKLERASSESTPS